MRRASLFLLVAFAAASVEARDRACFQNRGASRTGQCDSYAFFELAPASGAGMGSVCACATPTGAKGESMTFTRTGAATCTKTAAGGFATTGIADGDLVTCATNQPRVEYDSAGTLGVLVEGTRTNSVLYSEQFDNAVWTKANVGGGLLPIVTANQAIAPDGTLTADRVQFSSCPAAGDDSTIYQGASVGNATSSVYVKGVSGSGSISVCQYNNPANACSVCSFNSSSWTRCDHHFPTAAGITLILGCEHQTSSYPNSTDTGAADVYLWGAQHEAGAYATSYISTGATAVTRGAEAPPTFTTPSPIGPSFCMAASAWWPLSGVGAVNVLSLGTTAPALAKMGRTSDTAGAFLINATATTPAVSAVGTTQVRMVLSDASGTRAASWAGSSVSAPAASMTGASATVTLGALDGIISRVVVDTTGCQ